MMTTAFQQTLPTVREDKKGENLHSKSNTLKQSDTNPVIPLSSRSSLRQRASSKLISPVPNIRDKSPETRNSTDGQIVSGKANKSNEISSHPLLNNVSGEGVFKKQYHGGFDTDPNMSSVIDTVANINKDDTASNAQQTCKRKNSDGPGRYNDKAITKQTSTGNLKKALNKQPIPPAKASSATAAHVHKKMSTPTNSSQSTISNNPVSKLPQTSDVSTTNTPPRRSTSTDSQSSGPKKVGSLLQSMSGQQAASRLSFSSVTKKVTTLLKFRRGFLPKAHGGGEVKPPSPPPDPLPAKPRFSAFMSAEAQFALLKGYEDILAEKLVDQFPAEGAQIQRTRTPRHSIAISEFGLKSETSTSLPWAEKRHSLGVLYPDKDRSQRETNADLECVRDLESHDNSGVEISTPPKSYDFEKKFVNENSHNDGSTEVDALSAKVDLDENLKALNPSQSMKEDQSADRQINDNSPDKINRSSDSTCGRQQGRERAGLTSLGDPQAEKSKSSFSSLSSNTNNLGFSNTNLSLGNPTTRALNSNGPINLSRSLRARRISSLPEVSTSPRIFSRHLPRDRLLMMTHRMEKAMDILDVLRSGTEQALSPRVKGTSPLDNQQQQHLHCQVQPQRCLSERSQSHDPGTEPLRDFNRWAGQWSLEFRADSTN